MFPRNQYLENPISKKDNGRIKIITGLRRSGKSVLLFQLYKEWLLQEGINEEQIITLALDTLANARCLKTAESARWWQSHLPGHSKPLHQAV